MSSDAKLRLFVRETAQAAHDADEARPFEEVAAELAQHETHGELGALLAALAAADRKRIWVKARAEAFRRLGWRLMRPLLATGFLGALVFVLQRAIDPILGLTLFLCGAGMLYVILQLYLHRWGQKDEAALETVRAELRANLTRFLGDTASSRRD